MPLNKKKFKCLNSKCKFIEVIVGNSDKEINEIADAKFGKPSRVCPICRGHVSAVM